MFINFGVAPEHFYDLDPRIKAFYIASVKYAEENPEIYIFRKRR